MRETLLELDGEGEREEDRSWERPGFDLGFLSRRKKPDKRLSLGGRCASSTLNLGEGEFLAGWSTPGTERWSVAVGSTCEVSRTGTVWGEETWIEGEVILWPSPSGR